MCEADAETKTAAEARMKEMEEENRQEKHPTASSQNDKQSIYLQESQLLTLVQEEETPDYAGAFDCQMRRLKMICIEQLEVEQGQIKLCFVRTDSLCN